MELLLIFEFNVISESIKFCMEIKMHFRNSNNGEELNSVLFIDGLKKYMTTVSGVTSLLIKTKLSKPSLLSF